MKLSQELTKENALDQLKKRAPEIANKIEGFMKEIERFHYLGRKEIEEFAKLISELYKDHLLEYRPYLIDIVKSATTKTDAGHFVSTLKKLDRTEGYLKELKENVFVNLEYHHKAIHDDINKVIETQDIELAKKTTEKIMRLDGYTTKQKLTLVVGKLLNSTFKDKRIGQEIFVKTVKEPELILIVLKQESKELYRKFEDDKYLSVDRNVKEYCKKVKESKVLTPVQKRVLLKKLLPERLAQLPLKDAERKLEASNQGVYKNFKNAGQNDVEQVAKDVYKIIGLISESVTKKNLKNQTFTEETAEILLVDLKERIGHEKFKQVVDVVKETKRPVTKKLAGIKLNVLNKVLELEIEKLGTIKSLVFNKVLARESNQELLTDKNAEKIFNDFGKRIDLNAGQVVSQVEQIKSPPRSLKEVTQEHSSPNNINQTEKNFDLIK